MPIGDGANRFANLLPLQLLGHKGRNWIIMNADRGRHLLPCTSQAKGCERHTLWNPAARGAESPGCPLHRPGRPVAGVGVFDLTDANIVLASSWVILRADGSFSSEKRCRAADILDRRFWFFQRSL